jgi:hypothetical protein
VEPRIKTIPVTERPKPAPAPAPTPAPAKPAPPRPRPEPSAKPARAQPAAAEREPRQQREAPTRGDRRAARKAGGEAVQLGEALDAPVTITEGMTVRDFAEKLEEEGLGTLDALAAASPEQLEAVEGVGGKTAQAIITWAIDVAGRHPEGSEESEAAPEVAPAATELAGGDFMAALSKAFQEAEAASGEEE